MTPEQFAYWLQGFAEMNPEWSPTPEQWKLIKEHLQTVFKKVTPTLTQPYPIINPNQPLTMPGTTTTPNTGPYQSIPGFSPPTIIC